MPTPAELRRANQERGVAGLPTDYSASSMEARRQFRRAVARNEQEAEAAARSGLYATIDDFLRATGRTGTKDGGGQRLRNLYGEGGLYSAYGGGVNPNQIYDWGSGKKYNIATSDLSTDEWQDISPEEWASYNNRGAIGNNYWAYLGRQGRGIGGGGGGVPMPVPMTQPQTPAPAQVPTPTIQPTPTASPTFSTPPEKGYEGGTMPSKTDSIWNIPQQRRKQQRGRTSSASGNYVPGIGGM